ncbi:MAG TPA: hypothetical protein VF614_15835 [Chthoniobacteraceae bacterium]
MGLDTVELVMTIEEEFRIDISDVDAAGLAVLGDIHDYIIQTLRSRGEEPDEAQVWERLADIVVEQLGVRREKVTRSANVVKDLRAD